MEDQTRDSAATIRSVGERDSYPLSFEQKRFYAVQQFSDGGRSASIPVGMEMHGPLDADLLAACLPVLVERHPTLRTVIREVDGAAVQVILPTAPATLTQHSLAGLDQATQKRRIDECIENELKMPFALATGPLCRFILLELAHEEHVLLLSFHHIIADFLSIGIFLDELSELYAASLEERSANLRELPLRFVDFASFEKCAFTDEYRGATLEFWRSELSSHYELLDLPHDRPNPSQQVFRCDSEVLDFDEDTRARVSAFCSSNNLSKFVFYLAVTAAMLRGYTGGQKMTFGIPLGNRNFPELAGVMGTFANQSVAIADLSGNPSFRDLFSRLTGALFQATAKVVPIVDLINIMRREAGGSQRPLQVALTYLKDDVYQTRIPGVVSRPIRTGRDSLDIDLFFTVIKHDDGEALSIEYGESLFETSTILQMFERFQAVLDLVVSDPDRRVDDIFASGIFDPRETIQIASTFVADPLENTLRFWMRKQRRFANVRLSPYNQVFQQLVDPASDLLGNRSGCSVVLVRLEDWIGERPPEGCAPAEIERANGQLDRNVADFIGHLERASTRLSVPLIVAITPESAAMLAHASWGDAVASAQSKLEAAIHGMSGVSLLDARRVSSLYRLETLHDPVRDGLAHIPYTDAFYVSLGTAIAREMFAIVAGQRYKVVVVDCDNTLWRGVVGEDGAKGVVVTPGMRAFQEKLVRLRESGVVLCLCSKNAERDVLDVFEQRSDMVLGLDDVVARKINWSAKSKNLRELATELNLGLDSFVFIDDSPLECAEVRAGCPEVLTLQLPSSDRDISRFVEHVWVFDRSAGTAEDRERTQRYQENVRREESRRGAESFRAFVEGLSLRIEINPLEPVDLKRVSQLTYRTNQFNATTIRRSETDLRGILAGAHRCSTVHVDDRFGSYGLVGAMIYRVGAAEVTVDTFLLSCRVLGRGVEHRMLSRLGAIAESAGCPNVRIPTLRTEKNEPVLSFLDRVAAEFRGDEAGEAHYIIPASTARAIDFLALLDGPEGSIPSAEREREATVAGSRRERSVAAFVARTWQDYGSLEAVEREVAREASRPARREEDRALSLPETQLEIALAQIWSEVLGVDAIGVNEDIFDLGGTSFDVVTIMSRIDETFQVRFDHHIFLQAPTIEAVAHQIDYRREHGTFDETLAALDLEAEVELAPDVTAHPHRFVAESHPKSLLVTGVTGFLGAHLLRELLEQTTAAVHCHVRAADSERGMQRVVANLERYELWKPEYAGRLTAVPGDLGEPRLGIEESAYSRLSEGIDVIYHNGSVVDFIKPYGPLKDANVGGTEEVLRLATRKRLKPVVYVSTIAVFNALGAFEGASPRVISEDFLRPGDRSPLGGYAQSKWVAERLVAIASERGVPVCIFRPGEIGGSSETGLLNESDILSILFEAMADMHTLPDIETQVDFIPVDLLSRMMARISLEPDAMGRVYNLVHPDPVGMADYAEEVNCLGGPPVELVPYAEWTAQLALYAERTGNQRIESLMHLFTNEVHGGMSWIESTANRPEISMNNAAKHLDPDERRAFCIDRGLISRYLSRLRPEAR